MSKALFTAAVLIVVGLAGPVDAAVQWRKPEAEPGFKGLTQELQHLADRDGRARVNTFCAVVESERRPKTAKDLDGGYTWVLVQWKQQHLLYTFGAADDRYGLSDMNIFHSTPLDLRKDVVASEKNIDGSTFRVPRAWVSNIERHCNAAGTTFTIFRSGAR